MLSALLTGVNRAFPYAQGIVTFVYFCNVNILEPMKQDLSHPQSSVFAPGARAVSWNDALLPSLPMFPGPTFSRVVVSPIDKPVTSL